jgi:hypothetical protein
MRGFIAVDVLDVAIVKLQNDILSAAALSAIS